MVTFLSQLLQRDVSTTSHKHKEEKRSELEGTGSGPRQQAGCGQPAANLQLHNNNTVSSTTTVEAPLCYYQPSFWNKRLPANTDVGKT